MKRDRGHPANAAYHLPKEPGIAIISAPEGPPGLV